MVYVPKNTKDGCPGCQLLPLAQESGHRGTDVFEVPMLSLINQSGVSCSMVMSFQRSLGEGGAKPH